MYVSFSATAPTPLSDTLYTWTVTTYEAMGANPLPNTDAKTTVDVTAPTVAITSLSPDPTNDNTPLLSGTATDTTTNVVEIKYKVDSGTWQNVDSFTLSKSVSYAFTTSALSDGSHTVYVKAKDAVGNEVLAANYASDEFTVDTVPPSSSASSPQYDNQDTIDVSFTATDVTGTVVSTKLFYKKDDGAWTDSGLTLTGTSGTFTFTPSGDGVYGFYTIAADNADNTETAPATADSSTTFDTVAPVGTASILSSYKNSLTFDVAYTTTEVTSGVASVKLYYSTNGGTAWTQYGTTYTTSPISFTAESQGAYAFSVRALDNAGNEEAEPSSAGSIEATTTVDTVEPDTTITPLSPDPTNDNTPTLSGTATDATTAIVLVEYRVDGGAWIAATATNGAFNELSEDYTFTTSTLADGQHTVEVRATDAAGNVETTFASDTFSVDTVQPTIAVVSSDEQIFKVGSYTITATFSEDVKDSPTPQIAIAYALPSGTCTDISATAMAKTDTTQYTYDLAVSDECDAAIGIITISTAQDLAGNTMDADGTHGFGVDTVAPVFSATSPATDSYIKADFTVGYTLSENIASGTIKFNDGTTTQTYTMLSADLTSGTHTIQESSLTGITLVDGKTYSISLDGTDAAGNPATTVTNTNIKYDTTNPIAVISAPLNNAYVKETITITGTASDTNFKEYKVEYQKSGEITWTQIGATHTTAVTGGTLETWDTTGLNGLYTIKLTVSDLASNGKTASVAVNVDNTPPQVNTIDITPFDSSLGINYVSGISEISAGITEAGSGVASCEYTIDGTNWVTATYASNTCTASNVNTAFASSINMRATDLVENVGIGSAIIVVPDIIAPVTTDSGTDANWHNSAVTVTLSPVDSGSGIASTKYCVDQANTCTPTTSGISVGVSAEGINYVRYFSTDNVGNVENVKSAANTVKIDTPVPTATVAIAVPVGQEKVKNNDAISVSGTADGTGTTPSIVSATLKQYDSSGTEIGSGTDVTSSLSLLNGVISGSVSLGTLNSNTASVKIDVIVKDEANNQVTATSNELFVDNNPPSISSYALNGVAANAYFNPNTASVVITINANEPVKFNYIRIMSGQTEVKGFTSVAEYAASVQKTWNGKDPDNVVVSDGVYTIKVRIKDVAGNVVDVDLTLYTITVDTNAPLAPDASKITVTMNPPGTADTISGSDGAVEANSLVKIYKDAALGETNKIEETIADSNGAFGPISIRDNLYATVYVTATDAAGNEGLATQKENDIVAPSAPTVTQPTTPTNLQPITVSGSAEAGSTVEVFVDGVLTGTTTATTEGSFSVSSVTLTEGTNSITAKATDAAHNPSALSDVVNVVLDTQEPNTNDDYGSKNDVWQNSNQLITLTPTDPSPTSGIAWTKYCTDTANTCSPTDLYTTAITISAEDITYFRYASQDKAGNVQDTVSRTVKIDKTAPTAGVSGAPTNWQSSDATATADCSDMGGSNCDTDSYKLHISTTQIISCPTDVAQYTYSSPQTISQHSWVCSYAKDIAGNHDFSDLSEFKVDKTAPAGQLTGVPENWQKTDASIGLTCTDEGGSGCDSTKDYLTIVSYGQNCEPINAYENQLTVSQHSTACWKVTDNAGNTATGSSEIKVDNNAPTSTITSPVNNAKINALTGISGTSSDTGDSGVSKVEISIQGTSDNKYWDGDSWEAQQSWLVTSGTTSWSYTYTPDTDGTYVVISRATDIATNVEISGDGQTITFVYDTAEPSTTLTANPATPNGDNGWYKTTAPTITLSCDDGTGSGCNKVYYKWDSAEYTEYTATVTALEGIHIIYYYSTDNAGNTETERAKEFKVDTKNPTTTDDYASDGIWTNSDQTVTLTPGDTGGSGIKEVKYCGGSACNPTTVLSSPYQLSYTTDQDTIVRYQAWDNAGNPSDVGQYNVKLDKTAPISTVSSPESVISDAAQTEVEFTVNWSGNDGSGAGISNYSIQIKRDNQTWENWVVGTTSTSTTYEGTIGHKYCFRSKAADELGNEESYPEDADTCTSVAAYRFDISLVGKWNLFSSPVVPLNKNITKVLEDVNNNINPQKGVWTYDPSNLDAVDGWLTYNPEVPDASNLEEITAGYGYWIYMDNQNTLTIEGTVIPVGGGAMPPSRNLKANSWNLIGIYGVNNKVVSNALSSLYTQDGGQMWSWPTYYYEGGSFWGIGSDTATMNAGRGYWIHLRPGAIEEISYAGGDV